MSHRDDEHLVPLLNICIYLKVSNSQNVKKYRKIEIFAQKVKNVTQGDTAKNIQTTGIADPLTIEKKKTQRTMGSF